MNEVDALLTAISDADASGRQPAWERLQRCFQTDLEGTVAASESALVRALNGGDPRGASVLLAMLGSVTSHFPQVALRAEVLRLALEQANDLGPSAAMDAALQLARSEPSTLIGPWLGYLIAVTEMSLDQDERARELWRVLAEGDPASLPAIAEWTVGRALPRTRGYFAERLLALAEAIPHLAADIADCLATMEAQPEFSAVAEQVRLQGVASELAREAFPDAQTAPPPAPHAAPDPRVDDLLDDFITHRSLEALEPLSMMAEKSSQTLVTGLCEAIADLRAPPRDDQAARNLSFLLVRAVNLRPNVVPARSAAELLEDTDLRADIAINLLAALAHADARFVDVERSLHCSLVQPSLAAISELWLCIAQARPEAMLTLVGGWWRREGWESELGRLFSSELVELAARAPEHADAVIRLLEAQVVPEPPSEPGMIQLSIAPGPEDDLARLRERLTSG